MEKYDYTSKIFKLAAIAVVYKPVNNKNFLYDGI